MQYRKEKRTKPQEAYETGQLKLQSNYKSKYPLLNINIYKFKPIKLSIMSWNSMPKIKLPKMFKILDISQNL